MYMNATRTVVLIRSPTGRVSRAVNNPLPVSTAEERVEEQARVSERNTRELEEFIGELGGNVRGLRPLAKLLGGIYVPAVALVSSRDVEIEHDLGVIPGTVFWGRRTNGQEGHVIGDPDGSMTEPWTKTSVFVRGSVQGIYQLIII